MTDEEHLSETRESNRQTSATLAASSPDVNHLAMALIGRFLNVGEWYSTTFAAILATVWKVAVIGVPAMVTGAIIIDKVQEGEQAKREFEAKMFSLQTDIELKKLDRTMLGDGAMKTLTAISTKLDQQSESTQQLRLEVQQISADVQTLRQSQAATDRRVSGIAAQQAAIRKQIEARDDSG